MRLIEKTVGVSGFVVGDKGSVFGLSVTS